MKCLQLFIFPQQQNKTSRQSGMASLLALLEIVVLLGFGLGILYFTKNGMQNTLDYQQEVAMRLQIEGEVEADGHRNLEKEGSNPVALASQITRDIDGKYRLVITRKVQGDAIFIIGGIFTKGEIEQRQVVKGLWQKEGNRYVFQGWVP